MSLFNDVFQNMWHDEAFCDYGTSIRYSHKQIYEKVKYLHSIYSRMGVRQGDKIALCDKNSSNWAICFISVFTYGCTAVPLLADFQMEQVADLVKHSGAKLLLCGDKVNEALSVSCMVPMVSISRLEPYDSSFECEKVNYFQFVPFFDCWNEEDIVVLSYTSGSTGNPKGVMIPYRSLLSNVRYAINVFPEMTNKENFISMLPLAHMFGLAFEFFLPFCVGCHISFITKAPSPKVILQVFADVKPYLVITVPLVVEKIIRGKIMPVLNKPVMKVMTRIPLVNDMIYRSIRKKLTTAFGGNFREIIFGGAGLNRDVEELLNRIHIPYTSGYGMTECGPLISFVHSGAPKGTCGKVVSDMEVKVLSDDPQNVAGEIIVRGKNCMTGYYLNQEATSDTIIDGWLHTGDYGTIDREGHIFIRGRKKNMLLGSNGQNVYPEEVESKIQTLMPCDETVLVQRAEKFVALVYVSDATLKTMSLSRDQFIANINTYRKVINENLPKYSRLSAIEIRSDEFAKTPKKNVKRYLYK